MLKKTIQSLIIGLFIFLSTILHAQTKNLLLEAMQDEMKRNMSDLVLEGYARPFFINYSLLEENSFQIVASLGALDQISEHSSRNKSSVRILVGDYNFNDESLDNNLFSQSQANEIDLPLDDDYLGVRRSFWITTDNVYKNAARQFKKNQEMLKEQAKPLSEIPHRTFAKTPVSNIDIEGESYVINRTELENYIRVLSSVFSAYPDITNSAVVFRFSQGYKYLINSEGSVNRIPFSLGTLQITAQMKTKDGGMHFDQRVELCSKPDQLPGLEKIKAEVKAMADGIIGQSNFDLFKEEYTGPILFTDKAVSQLFLTNLFSEDGLIATNTIPGLRGYRQDQSGTTETKIGKLLFAEGMTVKALPKLKTYNNTELLGSFQVDDEGVVPEDETVLIEKGVLKNVLNDRTLTKEGQVANGLGFGPGVVDVSLATFNTSAELKAKLIAQAKKEGLEYGLLIKDAALGGIGLVDVYKVSVENGKEELLRAAVLKPITLKNFRKILGATKERTVQNTFFGGSGRGDVISFIVPQALLLEEGELVEARMPFFTEEEFVPSPLKK